MLSSENPPPDLPCSCEISRHKSSDENNQHQLDEEADLIKSGLDDNNICPLPNFTIRDYVFSARGKDIKNNWPFSQKNLQLCLKYGVNDVLPPFQSPDSIRNPSIPKCAAGNLRYSDGRLSVGQKLAVDIENINSSGSEKDKEFPSTTASQSCFDTNSVPPLKSPSDNPEFTVGASKKVERNIRSTVKKCRLVVKSNNSAEQKSNQDLIFNNSLISETMAAKVCPVCKTFSSSSNTTLNAHIDQCLSGESNIKWTENSKVIKHRIKPRKTRLMVDIYETARHCTLEDLDRRNETNWASKLGFPANQDLEACTVEKNKPFSSVNVEDVNVDDVYIDSNGTKLRILSKLSDLPSTASYDFGPSKLVEKDKGNKFFPIKKKNHLIQKEKLLDHCFYLQKSCSPRPDRLLKCSPYGQKSFYPRPEVNNGQQNKPEFCEDVTQPHIAYHDQMKSDELGIMIKPWVGSKRTGFREKMNLEHESRHPDKLEKNLRIKSGVSSLDVTLIKRNSASNSLISSDKSPLLAKDNHKIKKNLLCNNRHDGHIEQQPCSRKRPGISLLQKPQDCRDKNNHVEFSKFNVNQSRNDSSPNGEENDKNTVCPVVNNDTSFVSSRVSQHHTFSSEGKEFPYLGKKSPGHAIPSGSKDSSKPLINKTRVLKIQKKRGGFVNERKGDVPLKSLETSPKSDCHGVGKNIDSFTSGNVEMQNEFVCEPSYEIADAEAFVAFSKSFNSAFTGPTGPNVDCVSQHYGEPEMFCADEVGKYLVITHNSHEVAEMNATTEAQRNYYVDVDPIPIPGPPGSFLPSPGRMGSEELQGNSSLTTCRIQSSEDERGVVDMDSSDSPISEISLVSNSFAPRSESPSFVNLSLPSHVRQKLPEKKPTPEPEKIAANSSMEYARSLVSNNSEALFTACGEYCESPTTSTSNPVLRLMGKNLMVVNKDEDRSPQTRLNTQSSTAVENNPGPWSCVDNVLNIHNDSHSFSRIFSGCSSILENMQISMPAQHFDCNLSEYGFKVSPDVRLLHLSTHPSKAMLSNKSFDGNFTSSLKEPHEYASGCNLIINNELGSNIMLDTRTTYDNIEKVRNHLTHVDSSGSKQKEMILINGSPEISEAGLAIKAAHNGVNPFHSYQTRISDFSEWKHANAVFQGYECGLG